MGDKIPLHVMRVEMGQTVEDHEYSKTLCRPQHIKKQACDDPWCPHSFYPLPPSPILAQRLGFIPQLC